MDGIEFAILYTLQHRLVGDPKDFSGFLHHHVTLWRLIDKTIEQFFGEAKLPRCAGRDLFTGN